MRRLAFAEVAFCIGAQRGRSEVGGGMTKHSRRKRDLFRFHIFVLIAALLWGGGGCASRGAFSSAASPDLLIRPEAPAEYDFLVGQDFEQQGNLEAALAAYRRAVAKDPDAAVLHLRLSQAAVRLVDQFDLALEHALIAQRLDPVDAPTRVYLGSLYRLRGNLDEAEKYLQREDKTPISVDAGLLLSQMYLEAKRPRDAMATGKWVIAQAPEQVPGYFAISAAYVQLDEPQKAEQALRDALRATNGDMAVYQQLLQLRRTQGGVEAQIGVYREILSIDPRRYDTLRDLVSAYLSLDRKKEARGVLREIEKFYPDDIRSIAALAVLEYELRDFAAAAGHFERILSTEPSQYDFVYFLGLCRMDLGEMDVAERLFEDIPPNHERFADARIQLAAIFEKRNNPERALENLLAARGQRPSRSLEYYTATLMTRLGDYDDALRVLEPLLKETPDDTELLYQLGLVHGEAKQFEQMVDAMQRVIAQDPNHWGALNYLGYSWVDRGENLDQAETFLRRAVELRPQDGFILDSLGWAYYMQAQPLFAQGQASAAQTLVRRAIANLKRANALSGGDPVIFEHLGDAYLSVGDQKRALEMYRKALALGLREKEQPNFLQKYEALQRELAKP